ncbi:hypothetical protein BJY00DRAFT_275922 [Aspergillus carlsbadensis]|nr:hypothetical protein BJY00DRAFT_275922 [Aspergillus carlsbadensis]
MLTKPRKHGIYRPTLMGMLKSNPGRAIQSATAAAFALLPSPRPDPIDIDSSNSSDESLSATLTSLNALTTPLRGIGPATASLLLSVASPAQIPFYSDDTFLWLIVGMYPAWNDESGWVRGEAPHGEKRKMVKPSGELIAKYHVAEYKALFEAVQRLLVRLNGEREGEEVGCTDLEKVAFVVRHVGESGLTGIKGEDEDEEDEKGDEDVKVDSKDEGASRKKRKVRK